MVEVGDIVGTATEVVGAGLGVGGGTTPVSTGTVDGVRTTSRSCVSAPIPTATTAIAATAPAVPTTTLRAWRRRAR
jgi:hypothetical protein